MSKRKGLHKYKRQIRVLPQTSYNLDRLAAMSGLKTPGRVVDKLVREKKKKFRPDGGKSRKSRPNASAGRNGERVTVPANPLKKQLEAINALRPVLEREKARKNRKVNQ